MGENKHFIIESSQNRFLGSEPFSRTNEFLIAKGVEPIDWRL